jgi:hypothetical protein
MSYIVIRVWSFECDFPGCGDCEEYDGSFSITDARKGLRKRGWTTRHRRGHKPEEFCPRHAPTSGVANRNQGGIST